MKLLWLCDVCGEPVLDRDGYLTVDYAEAFRVRRERERLYRQKREAVGPDSLIVFTGTEIKGWPQPAQWMVLHHSCDPHPDRDEYWFAIERLRTPSKFLHAAAHISGKSWITDTTWTSVLYKAAELCKTK